MIAMAMATNWWICSNRARRVSSDPAKIRVNRLHGPFFGMPPLPWLLLRTATTTEVPQIGKGSSALTSKPYTINSWNRCCTKPPRCVAKRKKTPARVVPSTRTTAVARVPYCERTPPCRKKPVSVRVASAGGPSNYRAGGLPRGYGNSSSIIITHHRMRTRTHRRKSKAAADHHPLPSPSRYRNWGK